MRTIRTARERRQHHAHLEFLADRELAERHACPTCGAVPGTTCRNQNGEQVRYPAHPARYPKEGRRP